MQWSMNAANEPPRRRGVLENSVAAVIHNKPYEFNEIHS